MTPTVGRADAWFNGLQRMVTNGDVIKVHRALRKPGWPAPVEPVPVLLEAEIPEEEPAEPEVERVTVQAGEPWSYIPVPNGRCAYEFGTGRVIALYYQ